MPFSVNGWYSRSRLWGSRCFSAATRRARRVHRERLEPALSVLGIDDHDLGTVGFGQPRRDCLGDLARREILAFGIDRDFRRRDLRDEQMLDLANFGAVGHVGRSSGNPDLNLFELGCQPLRPTARRRIGRLDRVERMPAGMFPAIAGELAQRRRNGALQRGRRIVPGRIGFAIGQHSARLDIAVMPRVPPLARHVDPAAECEAIVDHDDLLVVRTAGRVETVELGMDPRMLHPPRQREDVRAAHERLERADVPPQQEDLELGIALGEPIDEVADRLRLAGFTVRSDEVDACVEIPADQHDPTTRLKHREPGVLEIVVGVDEHAHPGCLSDAPECLVVQAHAMSSQLRRVTIRPEADWPRSAPHAIASYQTRVTQP